MREADATAGLRIQRSYVLSLSDGIDAEQIRTNADGRAIKVEALADCACEPTR
jgi:hypothetical protein